VESDESGLCHLHRLGYSDGSRFTNVNCQSSCRANYSSCQFNADSVKAKAVKAAKVMSVTEAHHGRHYFSEPVMAHGSYTNKANKDHVTICSFVKLPEGFFWEMSYKIHLLSISYIQLPLFRVKKSPDGN
jgi:hypothetical protein